MKRRERWGVVCLGLNLKLQQEAAAAMILVLMVLLQMQFFFMATMGKISTERLAPAIYVFGDSTVDSGNNNYLPTAGKANYAPYGKNFPGVNSASPYLPTGRFSNGRTIADYIAEFIGLPYPAPYIGGVFFQNVKEGVNFASASCGILNKTGQSYGKCMSMGDQVEAFRFTLKKMKTKLDETEELTEHVAKSIIVISIGANDIMQGPMAQLHKKEPVSPDAEEFSQALVEALSVHLNNLYGMGLRKIVVFNVGPLGCVPSVVRTYPKSGIKGPCFEEANNIIKVYNALLAQLLKELNANLTDSHFVIGHEFELGYNVIQHPGQLGFTDVVNSCCKALLNGTVSLCIPLLQPCADPDKYFFWDAIHYSDAVSRTLAAYCFDRPSTCSPPIKDLVRL